MKLRFSLLPVLFAFFPAWARAEKIVLRVGYFPNITHAQGVIGSQTSREGHGWFEQRLGPDVTIQWFAFNAGPSAMEGVFAGAIDLTYVGPNPALNAYIRSGGDEIRVLAGAAEGGAALVVPADGRIKTPADFRGRKVATPQFGNTQDVAARSWLKKQGFRDHAGRGRRARHSHSQSRPTCPVCRRPDRCRLDRRTVGVALEQEAGGRVFLEQPDVVTTLLVASVRLLKDHPELAREIPRGARRTHELDQRPRSRGAGPGSRRAQRRNAPGNSAALVASAWQRLRFTADRAAADRRVGRRCAERRASSRNAIPLDRLFSGKP